MSMFSQFVMNFLPANTRRETLEGKEYLVVPTVMMTPGIREGSQGKGLYLPEHIGKTPQVWNHKPVTLHHPSLDGEGISACDPKILEAQKCGLIMNAGYDDRLKCESWLDEPKMKKNKDGVKVLNSIYEGKMVETSTGLFHDPIRTPGVWSDGKPYDWICANIRPDHLAIILNGVGACSCADGCGVLRNADGREVSFDDVRTQIRSIMRAANPDDYFYISDIFPKYFVVEREDAAYKIPFKISKEGKVTIPKSTPEQVRKVTTYITANGGSWTKNLNSQEQLLPSANSSDKIELNDGEPTPAPSSENTMTLPAAATPPIQTPVEMFRDIPNQTPVTPGQPQKGTAAEELAKAAGQAPAPAPVVPAPAPVQTVAVPVAAAAALIPAPAPAAAFNQQMTEEQFLAMAPPSIRKLVANAQARDKAVKTRCIEVILNKNSRFNPAWLEQQELETLKGLATLAMDVPTGNPLNNYSGQGDIPPMMLGNETPVHNAGVDEEILSLPVMNFGKTA